MSGLFAHTMGPTVKFSTDDKNVITCSHFYWFYDHSGLLLFV